MDDALAQAIERVQEALALVIIAWAAEHPDHPPAGAQAPHLPARQSDLDQRLAATIQRAEVACLRASGLRRDSSQVRAQAVQSYHATRGLRVGVRRSPEDDDPGEFTRVGPAILVDGTTRVWAARPGVTRW